RNVVTLADKTTDVILLGTDKQFNALVRKLKNQPFGLKKLGMEIKAALAAYDNRLKDIVWDRYRLPISQRTCIMGVLNVTPDSFSDGGRFFDKKTADAHAVQMVEDGADIIDIGGESTRPGAEPVFEEDEKKRVLPVIETLAGQIGVPISIDTYKTGIAQAALDAGAAMVNDISGLSFDPEMAGLAVARNTPVVIMHMQGTPRNMQENPRYESLIGEITGFLSGQAKVAESAGVAADRIIIDPGIGFGKTVEHNLEIVKRLKEFTSLGYPVMIGVSRKSFIGKVLGTEVDERLEGTAAAVACSVLNGASLVRVHDVKEMFRVTRLADAVKQI
ncbi:MAG: dihydropteroate synthase, partial [Actinomycetota bacterium]